jgi:hypothetical protein
VQIEQLHKVVEVKMVIKNRVSAKQVPEVYTDLTPKEEYERIKFMNAYKAEWRDRGAGRPTKKERRIQWVEFESSLLGSAETKKAGYVDFTGHKYGDQSYLLTIPASELGKGEYGIFYMSIVTATSIPVGTFSVK